MKGLSVAWYRGRHASPEPSLNLRTHAPSQCEQLLSLQGHFLSSVVVVGVLRHAGQAGLGRLAML